MISITSKGIGEYIFLTLYISQTVGDAQNPKELMLINFMISNEAT